MTRLLYSSPGMVALLVLIGCGESEPPMGKKKAIEPEEVRAEVKEAFETTGEYVSQELEIFDREARAMLAEWRAGLHAAIAERAHSATEDPGFQQEAESLLEKMNISEENLEQLQRAGKESWERLKQETEQLLNQIQEEFDELFE